MKEELRTSSDASSARGSSALNVLYSDVCELTMPSSVSLKHSLALVALHLAKVNLCCGFALRILSEKTTVLLRINLLRYRHVYGILPEIQQSTEH